MSDDEEYRSEEVFPPTIRRWRCATTAPRKSTHWTGKRLPVPPIAADIPTSLGDLTAEEMSNFCGACHRTWAQIAMSAVRGIDNVRFQPYRLTNSKCYNALDSRISCLACHDRHREVGRGKEAYDAKCAACHIAFNAPAPAGVNAEPAAHAPPCKVATKDCINCHMPKYEIRGSHYSFTDHWTRVVKPGEPYPG